ncbi:hypothetical protein TYRP_001990, partial [Tyrophagus putrescentiae]
FFWPFKARIWSSTDKQCLAAVNTPDFTRLCCLSQANKYGIYWSSGGAVIAGSCISISIDSSNETDQQSIHSLELAVFVGRVK